ncbi:hypothetical protein [Halomonas sp. H5]|uniref:hypothetical protein n=1 Tax=Halomonas sp. H5 TaxID=3423910 RepID=UPI003D36E1F7
MQDHDTTDPRINDHYDTTTLAREHLRNAESLFMAISKMLQTDHGVHHAKVLAGLGSTDMMHAADEMHEQAEILYAQEVNK